MEEKKEHEPINLLDLLQAILKHQKFVIWFVLITVAITAGVLLVLPDQYTAAAVITPVDQSQKAAGATGTLTGIASQFGLSIGSPSGATEIVAQLTSNVVREAVIRKHNLIPVFVSAWRLRNLFTGKEKTDNQKIWLALRYMDDQFTVNFRDKDNMIDVSIELRDPGLAVNVVNWMLTEVNDRMSAEAIRVAEKNKKYLDSIIDNTADPLIKVNIYNMIAQQIQTAMSAEAKG